MMTAMLLFDTPQGVVAHVQCNAMHTSRAVVLKKFRKLSLGRRM